ncbi:hypothetical protein D3C87_978540 [compost metagenome]
MANTIASRVSRLIEYPIICMKNITPIIDSGMVTTGITTERRAPRNRNTTTITISTASNRVFTTSSIEAWMNRVAS